MARVKNYDAHISNIKKEITETEKKILVLHEELEKTMKEKEQQDIDTLYKYVKENNISFSDVIKTLNFKNSENGKKSPSKREQKTAASRTSNNTKKLTNATEKKRPGRPKKNPENN